MLGAPFSAIENPPKRAHGKRVVASCSVCSPPKLLSRSRGQGEAIQEEGPDLTVDSRAGDNRTKQLGFN